MVPSKYQMTVMILIMMLSFYYFSRHVGLPRACGVSRLCSGDLAGGDGDTGQTCRGPDGLLQLGLCIDTRVFDVAGRNQMGAQGACTLE